MDFIRNGFQQALKELPRRLAICFVDKVYNGELAGVLNGNKEMQLAFLGYHLSNVDVETADGVARESLPFRLVTLDIWKTRNAMPLKTTMHTSAGQERDGRLYRKRHSSSGSWVRRRTATTIASSSSPRTLERGPLGPVLWSSTACRLRHLATVLGLIPSSRLNSAIKACDRCIAALTPACPLGIFSFGKEPAG